MQSKLVAAAAGVFSFGALVGWALTADHYEQKIKLKNEHIKLLRERPTNVFNHYVETPEKDDAEVSDLEIPRGDEESEADGAGETVEIIEEAPKETPEETKARLQGLIDQYTKDPDDVARFIGYGEREVVQSDTPPFVISQAKFAWDEEEGDDYEKITLTYYPKDRVLLDDEQEPINDVNNTVGWRNLNRFGDESNDPDVVFVRNRKMETDFEVVKEDESELPLHVKYGMDREEFASAEAAGILKFREDHGRSG